MQATRTPAFLRTVANALGALLLVPLLSACPKGDVGAPCNHGDVDPPDSKVVTFPALSCNDLICVYADEAVPPMTACSDDAACNTADPGKNKFVCDNGNCKLSSKYVLERSMCSKTCSSDDDCKDGGITKQVLAKQTNCQGAFKCVQIQKLGEFCCQKLCVCEDDLSQGTVDQLATECAALPTDPQTGKPICEDMMNPTPDTGG
jgi:hypothetical protein